MGRINDFLSKAIEKLKDGPLGYLLTFTKMFGNDPDDGPMYTEFKSDDDFSNNLNPELRKAVVAAEKAAEQFARNQEDSLPGGAKRGKSGLEPLGVTPVASSSKDREDHNRGETVNDEKQQELL